MRNRVNIILNTKKKIINPTFIIGFQGIGLVGSMASQCLADNLKCELIGHIESEFLPPMAILHKSNLIFPIRIYYNKKNNLVILSSEVPINNEFANEISEDITNLMKKMKATKCIILEGLITNNKVPNHKIINGIATNEKTKKFLNKNKIKVIDKGAILGITAGLLLQSLNKGFDSFTLMAECHAKIPDAIASSVIVKKVGELFDFNINTSELEKKGVQVEAKLKKILSSVNKMKDTTSKDSKVFYG